MDTVLASHQCQPLPNIEHSNTANGIRHHEAECLHQLPEITTRNPELGVGAYQSSGGSGDHVASVALHIGEQAFTSPAVMQVCKASRQAGLAFYAKYRRGTMASEDGDDQHLADDHVLASNSMEPAFFISPNDTLYVHWVVKNSISDVFGTLLKPWMATALTSLAIELRLFLMYTYPNRGTDERDRVASSINVLTYKWPTLEEIILVVVRVSDSLRIERGGQLALVDVEAEEVPEDAVKVMGYLGHLDKDYTRPGKVLWPKVRVMEVFDDGERPYEMGRTKEEV